MKVTSLRIRQIPDATYGWYLEYLEAMDARDVGRYSRFLAGDCRLSFNNEPATEGKGAIERRLTQYWKSFKGIEHELLNIYGVEHAFMLEALNHYERHDGKHVTCRAVALTDRDAQGFVSAVRLYSDVSAVFA